MMNHDEVLALYRPIRASIRHVLGLAVGACGRTDMMRAGKQLGLWSKDKLLLPEDTEAVEMLSDLALFEPNQRGRRAFDHFLSGQARQLDAADLALAQRMSGAVFSLFRSAGRHEAAGIWLQDLLDGDRRLWIMDEALEATATEGMIFGTRLFDAGPFHAGFGIIVQPDEETIEMCVQTKAHTGRLPFRHSLAATLYGDVLQEHLLPTPEQERVLQLLLEQFATDVDSMGGENGGRNFARKRHPGRG